MPVRQWVLSVPFELRLPLAKDPRALSAVGRIFVREVFHWQREQAALRGIARAHCGAVCFPQRFGGSLNLNVHYHVAVPDGVFTEGGDRAGFHSLPQPLHGDLDTMQADSLARASSLGLEQLSLPFLSRGVGTRAAVETLACCFSDSFLDD